MLMLWYFFMWLRKMTFSMFWKFQGFCFVNDSIESTMFICRIIYSSDRTIWLHQAVLPSYFVSITFLVLTFHVTGVNVLDAVLEAVFWVGLENAWIWVKRKTFCLSMNSLEEHINKHPSQYTTRLFRSMESHQIILLGELSN